MAKRKKIKAKELKHDPFFDWYQKQAERVQKYKQSIRRTSINIGLVIAVLLAVTVTYFSWTGTAESRLARAFDIFNAPVSDSPPTSPFELSYTTEEEKYRAALQAYQRVSKSWYYRFSSYRDMARYYEALCQLQLNASQATSLLEQLAQGDSNTARMAKLALAEHLLSRGEPARAETLLRQLTEDQGPLPPYQLQLGLAKALELQGKKEDAIALYIEVAKERPQQPERRQAVDRLADLAPAALDQLPEDADSGPPPGVLSRYVKK